MEKEKIGEEADQVVKNPGDNAGSQADYGCQQGEDQDAELTGLGAEILHARQDGSRRTRSVICLHRLLLTPARAKGERPARA